MRTRSVSTAPTAKERMPVLDVPFWDYGFGSHCQIAGIVLPLRGTKGTPGASEVANRIRRLIDLSPRLTQRVIESPGHIRRPLWSACDLNFDAHFSHVQIDGSLDDFFCRYSRVFSVPLDRNRPLWEAWYFTGVDDGAVLCWRAHHSMLDGLSAVELTRIMSDQGGVAAGPPSGLAGPVGLGPAKQGSGSTGLTKFAGTLHGILGPTKSTAAVWPRPIGSARALNCVSLPLSLIQGIRSRTNATMTGVYQTIVSLAVEALQPGLPAEFAVSLPMSVRHLTAPTHPLDLDSRQISTPLAIPLHIADPASRLSEIQRRLDDVKLDRERFLKTTRLASHVPRQVLQRAVISKIRRTNMIVSSCPGPKEPLTLLGSDITDIMLYTGLVPHNPLALVATRYADRLSIGIIADPNLVPLWTSLADELSAASERLDAATR